MSDSIIEIKDINVSYGSNHVLKDVNLNINNKDFYTFLGLLDVARLLCCD